MNRAEYLPSARRSLTELRLYLTKASGSRDVSRRFIRRLRAHCDPLASLPFRVGKERLELGTELRSSAFENYVVFFHYHQGQLQVVNIVEGHRDIPEMFSSTKP